MKQTFVVNTQDDIFEFERLLRSIISLMYPDWKKYIVQLAEDVIYNDMIKCPSCQENVSEDDYFCRWCGVRLKQESLNESVV